MNPILINSLTVLITFIGMEGVAWLAHKYLMHGFLWTLHEDHHHKEHFGFFERNDFFFLIFAIPGIAGLMAGIYLGVTVALYIGIGITLYGFTYFWVHEIFIHQRFKLFRNTESAYFRAIRRAHKIHHKHLGKEDGECFGMLWVPFKYFAEAKKVKQA